MKILHISAECYPAAKAGGLGDVVGALPSYLNKAKVSSGVVIPKYHTKWIMEQNYYEVYSGIVRLHNQNIYFRIEELTDSKLGFPLFVVDIPGKYDRPGVYADPFLGHAYGDEIERALCFQQAVLTWVNQWTEKPSVLHCHDHHTGLIPFMVKYCPQFSNLRNTPTIFTIHNGEYHGAYGWDKMYLLPYFESEARGILDWNNTINPLATAIKTSWKFTTVSPGYMDELKTSSNGLEWLISQEGFKAVGILNGIDTKTWDPSTDKFIDTKLKKSIPNYKKANKKALTKHFNIKLDLPVITFIGRLVGEKGADLIPEAIARCLHSGRKASFVILGTGQKHLHDMFRGMKYSYPEFFDVALEYNEGKAHQLYAGSDFLMMPSKVEPCGLNQMYALRYGTVPIVRRIGGLRDSIIDIGDPYGSGITFNNYSVEDLTFALARAIDFYQEQETFSLLRERIMDIDFSWEKSAQAYIKIYKEISNNTI